MANTIGDRIDYLRFMNNGMTKKQLSEETNLSRQTLSNIESGKTPAVDTLLILADYFHVSVDYLLCRTNVMENTSADIDSLSLSEAARYALEENDVYGMFLSRFLENKKARQLIRQIDLYFSGADQSSYQLQNQLFAETLVQIQGLMKKKGRIRELESDPYIDMIEGNITDYDKTKIQQFSMELADILKEIKISYPENEDTRQDMMQAQTVIQDVKDETLTKVGALSKLPVKAKAKLTTAFIKQRKILGQSNEAYYHFEKIMELMLMDSEK